MELSKGLFISLILAAVISNASLQTICSVRNNREKNECSDLCEKAHGKFECKKIGQDDVCECKHNIGKNHPKCPVPTTDACRQACATGPFECRIVNHSGACYCTGLEYPIKPHCPTDVYRECRMSCGHNSVGVCVNLRGQTNSCNCSRILDSSDSVGGRFRG